MTEYGLTKIDGHTRITSSIFPEGDFVVVHGFSAAAPTVGSYGVWCVKHQTMMNVKIDPIRDSPSVFEQKILRAAAGCPVCIAEKNPLPETRWPEGAEL